jgi:hypothetical protein
MSKVFKLACAIVAFLGVALFHDTSSAQYNPCLGFIPGYGYVNKCTPGGRAAIARYRANVYGYGYRRNNACLGFIPGYGYVNKCSPAGRAAIRRYRGY